MRFVENVEGIATNDCDKLEIFLTLVLNYLSHCFIFDVLLQEFRLSYDTILIDREILVKVESVCNFQFSEELTVFVLQRFLHLKWLKFRFFQLFAVNL